MTTHTPRAWVAGLLLLGGTLWTSPSLSAQVVLPSNYFARVELKGDSTDYRRYRHFEDCLQMAERVTKGVRVMQKFRADTMPDKGMLNSSEMTAPEFASYWQVYTTWPAEAVAAATSCMKRVDLTAGFKERGAARRVDRVMGYLIKTNRDTAALQVAQQWLATMGEGQEPRVKDSLRNIELQEIALNFTEMAREPFRPSDQVRPALAFVQLQAMNEQFAFQEKFYGIEQAFAKAVEVGDTVTATRAAEWMVAAEGRIVDSLAMRLGANVVNDMMVMSIPNVKNWLRRAKLRATIAAGGKGYQDLVQEDRERKLKIVPNGKFWPPMPELTGDFWFPAKSAVPIPVKGKVNVFYVHMGRMEGGWEDQAAAEMSRIKARFPNTVLTIVTPTLGYFDLTMKAVSPEEEARLQDSLWRKHYKLDATVVVQNLKFWRLPNFDGRRIDEVPDWYNKINYTTSRRDGGGNFFVVDKLGTLTETLWEPWTASDKMAMLSGLHAQPAE